MNVGAHRRIEIVWIIGILLVLAVASTWPLVRQFDSHVVGYANHPGFQGDLFFHWNIDRQMEMGGLDYLHSPMTLHPDGEDFRAKVAFSFHQILFVAFQPFFELIPAHNLAVFVILIANGTAAWMLFRKRSENLAMALACSVLFAFGPWMHLKLDQGFLQKATLFHFPLMILFLFRFLEKRRLRDALGCLIFLVISVLVYPPFAAFNLAFSAVVASAWLFDRRSFKGLRLPAVLFGLAVVLIGSLVWAIGSEDFLLGDRMTVGGQDFRTQGGYFDLFNPIRGFPYIGTFGDRPFQEIVEGLPLGLPVVPLCLAGLALLGRSRMAPWLLGGAFAVLIVMAGPYLMRGGEVVLIGGKPFPLPFLFLERLPFSQVFRFPIRLYPWMLTALLLAGCQGVDWIRRRAASGRFSKSARILPILAAVLIVIEPLVVFPEYRRFQVDRIQAPWYGFLLDDDSGGALLHLPYFPPGPHDYLMTAVLCDRPIVNGWSWRPPPIEIPGPRSSAQGREKFLYRLQEAGVAAVVLHAESYDFIVGHPEINEPSLPGGVGGLSEIETWLEDTFGSPVESDLGREKVYLVTR